MKLTVKKKTKKEIFGEINMNNEYNGSPAKKSPKKKIRTNKEN